MNRCRLSPLVPFAVAASLLASLPACSHLPFRRHKEDPAEVRADAHLKTNAQGLAVEIKSSPDQIKIGEIRQIDVTVILRNTSKVPRALEFPDRTNGRDPVARTQQRQGRSPNWSTDRIFNADARYLLINPQERLEFNEPITTRELVAGKPYTLEAFFVGYEKDLHASKAIVTQP